MEDPLGLSAYLFGLDWLLSREGWRYMFDLAICFSILLKIARAIN